MWANSPEHGKQFFLFSLCYYFNYLEIKKKRECYFSTLGKKEKKVTSIPIPCIQYPRTQVTSQHNRDIIRPPLPQVWTKYARPFSHHRLNQYGYRCNEYLTTPFPYIIKDNTVEVLRGATIYRRIRLGKGLDYCLEIQNGETWDLPLIRSSNGYN